MVTVDLQGPVLTKRFFSHQIQDLYSTLSESSKENHFKNLWNMNKLSTKTKYFETSQQPANFVKQIEMC